VPYLEQEQLQNNDGGGCDVDYVNDPFGNSGHLDLTDAPLPPPPNNVRNNGYNDSGILIDGHGLSRLQHYSRTISTEALN
jgi:hypothetical protein